MCLSLSIHPSLPDSNRTVYFQQSFDVCEREREREKIVEETKNRRIEEKDKQTKETKIKKEHEMLCWLLAGCCCCCCWLLFVAGRTGQGMQTVSAVAGSAVQARRHTLLMDNTCEWHFYGRNEGRLLPLSYQWFYGWFAVERESLVVHPTFNALYKKYT